MPWCQRPQYCHLHSQCRLDPRCRHVVLASEGPPTKLQTSGYIVVGDAERAAGLPVSSLSDRHGVDVGDSQAAFIEYVVRPAYQALQPLCPKTVATALRLIDENKVITCHV